MITVLFFGPVAEEVGQRKLSVPHQEGMRLLDLKDSLADRYPEAFALVSLAAIDGEHVDDFSSPLSDGAEVVFMSKFSGG